jgi:hypothetical protein
MLQEQQHQNHADRDRRETEYPPGKTPPGRPPGDHVEQDAQGDDERRRERDQPDQGHAAPDRRLGQLSNECGHPCRCGIRPLEGHDLPGRGVREQRAQQPIV